MVEKKPESKGIPSTEVSVVTLKNIGPQSAKWLAAVGIVTKKDLEDAGAVNAFRLMRSNGLGSVSVSGRAAVGRVESAATRWLPLRARAARAATASQRACMVNITRDPP